MAGAFIKSICFYICLFFQIHEHDIKYLPEVLAEKALLLPELLQKSRASNTGKKNVFFFDFISGFCVEIYLASLIQTSITISPVISAFYSIKWYHDING